MPEGPGVQGFIGTKGPKTYKAAKGSVGRGTYSGKGQKPAKKQRISSVDKRVKRISNKIVGFKSAYPGKAAHNRY